jgi:hypothetical protein
MFNIEIKKSPAVIRGVEVEKRGRLTFISFIAVLGEADGTLLVFSENQFFRHIKKAKRQVKNVRELNGEKCIVNIINNRKIEFAGLS